MGTPAAPGQPIQGRRPGLCSRRGTVGALSEYARGSSPAGTLANPGTIAYRQCPTSTVQTIAAGSASRAGGFLFEGQGDSAARIGRRQVRRVAKAGHDAPFRPVMIAAFGKEAWNAAMEAAVIRVWRPSLRASRLPAAISS